LDAANCRGRLFLIGCFSPVARAVFLQMKAAPAATLRAMVLPRYALRCLALPCCAGLCAMALAQEPAPPAPPQPAEPAASAPTLPADSTAPDAVPQSQTGQTSESGPIDNLKQRVEDTLDSWEEFLNELLIDALGPNYERRYRVFGQKKTVDLGKRWMLSLDERQTGLLNSAGTGIPAAGRPSRTYELTHVGKINDVRFYNQHDGTGLENGGSIGTTLGRGFSLQTSGRRLHDDLLDVARTDAQVGLRYGPRELWVEGFVHHAQLEDRGLREPWVDREPKANFAGVQAQWEAAPGLAFSAQHQRAIKPEMAPGDERLADPRTEIGADWRPGGRWSGSRVYWRESPQLGLLASHGVDERTTYKRVIGGEIPEGSPDGMVYAQVRQHSLASDEDALLVLGWRHTRELAPKWQAQSLIESGIPVAGDALRSTLFDLRIQHNDFPRRALGTELQAVRTPVRNSDFASADYTQRLGNNTLFVTRASATDLKSSDPLEIPVIFGDASVGLGWQEPEERRFSTFWRFTALARDPQRDGVVLPGAAKRRARIAFGELEYQPVDTLDLLLRASRRWDRDESFQAGAQRITDLYVLRPTYQLDRRWRFGFHAAHWKDDALGVQRGYGIELAVQMKRKVVLAFGYNAKGIDDGELAADDRLGKGFKLRLYIPTEATLRYWLRSARGEEKPANVR
jgi:hypothetical protein